MCLWEEKLSLKKMKIEKVITLTKWNSKKAKTLIACLRESLGQRNTPLGTKEVKKCTLLRSTGVCRGRKRWRSIINRNITGLMGRKDFRYRHRIMIISALRCRKVGRYWLLVAPSPTSVQVNVFMVKPRSLAIRKPTSHSPKALILPT